MDGSWRLPCNQRRAFWFIVVLHTPGRRLGVVCCVVFLCDFHHTNHNPLSVMPPQPAMAARDSIPSLSPSRLVYWGEFPWVFVHIGRCCGRRMAMFHIDVFLMVKRKQNHPPARIRDKTRTKHRTTTPPRPINTAFYSLLEDYLTISVGLTCMEYDPDKVWSLVPPGGAKNNVIQIVL